MSELVELPPHSRQILLTKLSLDEGVTHLVINDHILKSRASLIMARPSAVHKLKLTILDELPHFLLLLWILLVPPLFEILELRPCELSCWFFAKRYHNGGQNCLDASHLVHVPPVDFALIKVAIYGLVPPNVIMGVWHQVDRCEIFSSVF